jgi:hypothetical protein
VGSVCFHPEPLALCPLERRLDRLLWMFGSQLYTIRCELATRRTGRVCGRLSAGERGPSGDLAVSSFVDILQSYAALAMAR